MHLEERSICAQVFSRDGKFDRLQQNI